MLFYDCEIYCEGVCSVREVTAVINANLVHRQAEAVDPSYAEEKAIICA